MSVTTTEWFLMKRLQRQKGVGYDTTVVFLFTEPQIHVRHDSVHSSDIGEMLWLVSINPQYYGVPVYTCLMR